MGTLTETVPSRAVRARRGNRGLATALHLDLAYLLGDGAMQSFASVLLAPVFSIMFNGGAFVDGFGFRLDREARVTLERRQTAYRMQHC